MAGGGTMMSAGLNMWRQTPLNAASMVVVRRHFTVEPQPVLSVRFRVSAENQPTLQLSTASAIASVPLDWSFTAAQLAQSIIASESSQVVDAVSVFSADGLPVREDAPLRVLLAAGFALQLNNTNFAVAPIMADLIKTASPATALSVAQHLPAAAARTEAALVSQLQAALAVPAGGEEETRLRDAVTLAVARQRAPVAANAFALRQELTLLREEYEKQSTLKSMLDRRAHSTVNLWAWGSLGFFATQWVAVAYGTYWLYSWDIMEPITYLLGAADVVGVYGFHALRKRDYSPGSLRENVVARRTARLYQSHNFTLEEFNALEAQIAEKEALLKALGE